MSDFSVNFINEKPVSEPTYPAARAVSVAVGNHFRQHFDAARANGAEKLLHEPTNEIIEAIIDIGFWASLGREEGRSPKISIAFLPPEMAGLPMVFDRRLLYQAHVLTKLAPAVERPGIHLGIWIENGELYIWGTTRDIPSLCFVLEVVDPGFLVIKHRRIDGLGKFVNVATIKGDKIKVVDEHGNSLYERPQIINSLLGFSSPYEGNESVNILVQLAASMRAHGRGGCLLVVPSGTDEWKESIIHPITYPVQPSFSKFNDLEHPEGNDKYNNNNAWKTSLREAVDSIGGLTAVDGATIISDKYELLAFGAKIGRSWKNNRVDQIVITEPVIGSKANVIHPANLGGTRHLSAAQFVYDQRDAVALVASQDGRFTIFAWSDNENMVHAHQIDILLL